MHDAMSAGIWPHNLLLPRQGNGHTRHTLSIQPQSGPDFPLDITIHHAHITPTLKEAFQQAFVNNLEMRAVADLIITGWPKDIKEVPHPLHPYWQHRETLTVKDGLVLWGEALVIPSAKRERVLHQLHQFHQGITKSQLLACGSFFWPSINKAIEEVVCQCETCTQFQSQNAAMPLTPTSTPSHPWQMCATDIFTLKGVDHLVVGDFYSKMIFIRCIPPGQSNANKVVLLLKEMFSEHGIPKVLHSDNGPQYASVQFTDFCISWGISHETSSLHYPQSNGFAEACIKSIKMHSKEPKYSGADPQLALLALQLHPSTPSFHLQQSCCTNANSEQPFWPRYATATHQPYKSVSRSIHALKLLNHRLTNIAKHLHRCMLVNQLQCMTSSKRFGFLLLWYMSYHGTAIKYAPAMVPHTTACRDTFMNAVSKQSTLSPVA